MRSLRKSRLLLRFVLFLMLFGLTCVPCQADIPTSGDWVVTGTESAENQSALLNGNLIIEEGGSLTLSNVDLEIGSPGDAPYGLNVKPGGSLSVNECNIFSNAGQGFTFRAGNRYKDHAPESADLVIVESRLRGVNGLELMGVDEARIEGVEFLVNVPNSHTICLSLVDCHNCLIKDNDVKVNSPVSPNSMLPVIGIASSGSHFNTITGNQISDTRNGIILSGSWNNRVADNIWIGPIGEPNLKTLTPRWWAVCTTSWGGEAGLFLGPWSNNNVVENNTFLLSITGIMIIERSGSNKIVNNTAKGAGIGLTLIWASNNIVDGNEFADIFREDAIHAFAAKNNTIINNTVSTASGGIGLHSSNENTVKGNRISDSGRGIFLHVASANLIENNDVSSTAMPIVLSLSTDNTIISNNLAQDGLQRFDDENSNTWENNYWENDAVSPYPIPPNGQDNSPSSAIHSISYVPAPEQPLMEYTNVPHKEWIIEDDVVWQDQTVTLKEGLCVRNGGSLTLKNVTLNFLPEEIPALFWEHDPLSITIGEAGSLSITDSMIVGPQWGPLSGFRIIAQDNANITVRRSEIHNGGIWAGDGAISIENGVSGAIIENNQLFRTYCAISLEDSYDAIVSNNTVSNSVFGINIIQGEDHTISGNRISRTAWKGIGLEAVNILVSNNEINDSWGVGIFPYHWGLMPENNTFTNVKGASLLSQSSDILTAAHGFRAFSYDSTDAQPGQNITAFVRIAHTSPVYGMPGFPETIQDVTHISHGCHLRINGQIIDSKQACVDLGNTTMVRLSGVASVSGIYSVNIEHKDTAGDINNDGIVDLADALIACKAVCGLTSVDTHTVLCADVDGDNRIGLSEILYVMRQVIGGQFLGGTTN